MKFTKRTYKKAYKRSFNIEYQLFRGAMTAEMNEEWFKQKDTSNAIKWRAQREGKAWWRS